MGFDAIETGIRTLLKTKVEFDEKNTAYLDLGILETATKRWAAITFPGPLGTEKQAFGAPVKTTLNWRVILSVFIQYTDISEYSSDTKTVLQSVVDALKSDQTLSNSCDDSSFSLVDFDSIEIYGKSWGVFTFHIEAWEY